MSAANVGASFSYIHINRIPNRVQTARKIHVEIKKRKVKQNTMNTDKYEDSLKGNN